MIKTVLRRFNDAKWTLLVQLLPHLASDDLLIMDRGFPAVWLFTLLLQRGLPIPARMNGNQWPTVERFMHSNQSEAASPCPYRPMLKHKPLA